MDFGDFVHFREVINNLTNKYDADKKIIGNLEEINNEFRQKFQTLRDENAQILDQINKTTIEVNEISKKIGEKQWAQKRASLANYLEDTKINIHLQQMKEHQQFLGNHMIKNDDECLDPEEVGRRTKVDAERAKAKKDELFAQLSSLVDIQRSKEDHLAQVKAECEISKKRNAARLLRLRKSLQEVEVSRRRVRARYQLLQNN